MTRVVFYISGHGFGHASRGVEVINALGPRLAAAGLATDVLIRSAVDPYLLKRTLRVPHQLRPLVTDPGIAQLDSVTHDDARTFQDARHFYATFDQRVEAEADVMSSEDVAVIVGDVPPLAPAVAARLGVPSIAIGNFLWDWIYEGFPELMRLAPDLVPTIRRAYAKTTLGLRLPFSHRFESMPRVVDLPLVARHAARSRAETRAHFGLSLDRPMALLSFGGYGLPSLDLDAIDCKDRWSVVVTDRSIDRMRGALPRHVHQIAEASFVETGFRYEDLVAAVDVVVSKPGYGIVAECIATGMPLLYTSRGDFREYDVFVDQMPHYLRCGFIAQPDLFAGRWRESLSAVIAEPPAPRVLATNGAEVAANHILSVIDASR